MTSIRVSVHPELVEGLPFFPFGSDEGQGFDKLSPNGKRGLLRWI